MFSMRTNRLLQQVQYQGGKHKAQAVRSRVSVNAHLRQQQPVPLAAGQHGHRLLLVAALEVEPAAVRPDADLPPIDVHDLGTIPNLLKDGPDAGSKTQSVQLSHDADRLRVVQQLAAVVHSLHLLLAYAWPRTRIAGM